MTFTLNGDVWTMLRKSRNFPGCIVCRNEVGELRTFRLDVVTQCPRVAA